MESRFLLLQARQPGDRVAAEERFSFVRFLGVGSDRLTAVSLVEEVPTLAEVRQHDALLMGGSGDFDVSKGNLPHHDRLLDLWREVASVGHPTYASCFGFHYLVQALGGEIAYDPPSAEVGTVDLVLTEEGARDELFSILPSAFPAQMGHKERAVRFPAGSRNLVRSERCPYQALRIPGQPIWDSQFHPELDRKTNLNRFERYHGAYSGFMNAEQKRDQIAEFRESSETARLLPRFRQVAL